MIFTTYTHDEWSSRHIQLVITTDMSNFHDIYHDIYSRWFTTTYITTYNLPGIYMSWGSPVVVSIEIICRGICRDVFSSWTYVVEYVVIICREGCGILQFSRHIPRHIPRQLYVVKTVYVVKIFFTTYTTIVICRDYMSWKISTPLMWYRINRAPITLKSH